VEQERHHPRDQHDHGQILDEVGGVHALELTASRPGVALLQIS